MTNNNDVALPIFLPYVSKEGIEGWVICAVEVKNKNSIHKILIYKGG